MARSAIAHSIDLMVTGFSSMLSVQDASHGAGQTRPVTSGKLLVECRLRAASSQLPLIDEVVPVGDLVVDRAARRAGRQRAGAHAIGHAAIHAARGLGDVILLRQRQHELAPMAHALGDRLVVAVLAFVFEKAGDLAHCAYSAAMAAAPFISLSARRYSTGMTLRNFGYNVFQSSRILAATAEPV